MGDKRGDKKRALRQIKKPSAYQGNNDVKLANSYNSSLETIDYPIFCFKHMLSGYALRDCDDSAKVHLMDKIDMMTQKTWDDLFTGDHYSGSGFETIPVQQFKVSMPSFVTEDVGKLYVMRFNGRAHRLIGMRRGPVFHITHIDVGLSAYDH